MKITAKNIFHSTAFIVALATLLLITSVMVKPRSMSQGNVLDDPLIGGIMSEKENSIDVIFLGDSESYSAFIPLSIWNESGVSSYVCGSTLQKLCYSYKLLSTTFKHQSPKIVVLETDTIYSRFSGANVITSKAQDAFCVFKYHDRWKSLLPKGWQSSDIKERDERARGYLYSTAQNPASTDGYMAPSDKAQTVPKECLKYIEKIKALCEKNGAQLLLVSVPSTKNWSMEKHNGVDALARRLGMQFIDMNLLRDEIPIDWATDTRDKGDHLNYYGAAKVSAYMGRFLAEQGVFSDKRGDPEYGAWNSDAAAFLMINP